MGMDRSSEGFGKKRIKASAGEALRKERDCDAGVHDRRVQRTKSSSEESFRLRGERKSSDRLSHFQGCLHTGRSEVFGYAVERDLARRKLRTRQQDRIWIRQCVLFGKKLETRSRSLRESPRDRKEDPYSADG